jgi:hypothetical protein
MLSAIFGILGLAAVDATKCDVCDGLEEGFKVKKKKVRTCIRCLSLDIAIHSAYSCMIENIRNQLIDERAIALEIFSEEGEEKFDVSAITADHAELFLSLFPDIEDFLKPDYQDIESIYKVISTKIANDLVSVKLCNPTHGFWKIPDSSMGRYYEVSTNSRAVLQSTKNWQNITEVQKASAHELQQRLKQKAFIIQKEYSGKMLPEDSKFYPYMPKEYKHLCYERMHCPEENDLDFEQAKLPCHAHSISVDTVCEVYPNNMYLGHWVNETLPKAGTDEKDYSSFLSYQRQRTLTGTFDFSEVPTNAQSILTNIYGSSVPQELYDLVRKMVKENSTEMQIIQKINAFKVEKKGFKCRVPDCQVKHTTQAKADNHVPPKRGAKRKSQPSQKATWTKSQKDAMQAAFNTTIIGQIVKIVANKCGNFSGKKLDIVAVCEFFNKGELKDANTKVSDLPFLM